MNEKAGPSSKREHETFNAKSVRGGIWCASWDVFGYVVENRRIKQIKLTYFCPMTATIHTDHGPMTVEFFEKDAPKTVANFVKLAKEFYEGLKFHRVIPGFVAQGGCPHGIGNGGPGYTIDCELDGDNQYHDKVLSMAHAGRNTGALSSSSCTAVRTRPIWTAATCFGKVTELRHRRANRPRRHIQGGNPRRLIQPLTQQKRAADWLPFCLS